MSHDLLFSSERAAAACYLLSMGSGAVLSYRLMSRDFLSSHACEVGAHLLEDFQLEPELEKNGPAVSFPRWQ